MSRWRLGGGLEYPSNAIRAPPMVEVVVFSVCKRAAKRGGASQPPQKRGAEASRVDPELEAEVATKHLHDGQKQSQSFLCADLRPRWPIVATAPHHGAETNRAAYGHMCAWADIIVLLRAGGDRDQPGPTFKSLSRPFKVCATCPQSGRRPVLAGVAATGHWPWFAPVVVMGQPCVCA
jgi:hypothetical protein